jgi:hypothetical protein
MDAQKLQSFIERLEALPERSDPIEWQRQRTVMEILTRAGVLDVQMDDIRQTIRIPFIEGESSFDDMHLIFRVALRRLLRRQRGLETEFGPDRTILEPVENPPLPTPRTHKASKSPFLNPLDTED